MTTSALVLGITPDSNLNPLAARSAELVAAVDPAGLTAVLARFPEAKTIRVRDGHGKYNPHSLRAPPKDQERRQGYLVGKIEEYRLDNERNVAQYTNYRDNGLKALSSYDICISSGGNALGALKMALSLKTAHISYNLTMMLNLQLELAALNAELERHAQFDFFQ